MSSAGNAEWLAKSPTSTLSSAWHRLRVAISSDHHGSKGIELLRNVVWYRSKAGIKKIFGRGYPGTFTSHSRVSDLPQELVEMIIAHVILDTPTLEACSTTCRSWYLAALPHLHHTLTLHGTNLDIAGEWLTSLQRLSEMRLLPFVKRLQIEQSHAGPHFRPTILNAQSFVRFLALTNVQELGITELDFSVFTPQAQQNLGRSMPMLQSLALKRPRGAYRQLLHFIGLFPNLDDLEVIYDRVEEPAPDLVPTPQSAPSLRGRLELAWVGAECFVRDLSKLSGGLRFRHMGLLGARGTRFLLDACADTLETLRIYPVFWIGSGEEHSQAFRLSPVDPPTRSELRNLSTGP